MSQPDTQTAPTDELTVEQLREEAQRLRKELDYNTPAHEQEPEWTRHDKVCKALRNRSDVTFPECPADDCTSTRWMFAAGNPPRCASCGREATDADLGEAIYDASDRLVHGPDDE